MHVERLRLREEKGCISDDKISVHELFGGQRATAFSKSHHVNRKLQIGRPLLLALYNVLRDIVKGVCYT